MDKIFDLSPEMIIKATVLFVPGFIFNYALNIFSPRKENNSLIKLLALGLLNFSVCSFIFDLSTNYHALKFISVVFIMPLSLGCIWSISTHLEFLKKLLNKLHLNTKLPCPTAWDYVFNKLHIGARVIVRLKNNNVIYGDFQTSSFASDSYDRDLYLEKFYAINTQTNVWEEVKTNKGIYINNNEISSIEFFE